MPRGRLKGRTADFDDYRRYFDAEQINKFSSTEVGFVDPSPDKKHHCGACFHWFENPATGWTPCEIMRLGTRTPVPGSGACRFQTSDGKTYPLLEIL